MLQALQEGHQLVMALIFFIDLAHSAEIYCTNDIGSVATSSLSFSDPQEHPITLLTTVKGSNRYRPSQRCIWEVSLRDLSEPRHLVLMPRTSPMPGAAAARSAVANQLRRCDSRLDVKLEGSDALSFHHTWHNGQSMPRVPLIAPVSSSSKQLIVSFTTGDSEPSADCERIELSITVAKKGFCARNMLLHQSRCHFISDRELDLEDVDGTSGEVRLASFSSMDDVTSFVQHNEQARLKVPYEYPVNLTQPVRIGLFLCPRAKQAIYLLSNSNSGSSSACLTEPFSTTGHSAVRRNSQQQQKCGSLQASASGAPKLTFGDCSRPMRTLLSFGETPSSIGRVPCAIVPPTMCRSSVDVHVIPTIDETSVFGGSVSVGQPSSLEHICLLILCLTTAVSGLQL